MRVEVVGGGVEGGGGALCCAVSDLLRQAVGLSCCDLPGGHLRQKVVE
jgi:hypothetical protein